MLDDIQIVKVAAWSKILPLTKATHSHSDGVLLELCGCLRLARVPMNININSHFYITSKQLKKLHLLLPSSLQASASAMITKAGGTSLTLSGL